MANPIITTLFDDITRNIEESVRKVSLDKLWLGGSPGPSGGSGGRPGGYIGLLPQTQVAYDTTEAALVTGSGTLLDNLNHIRALITGIAESHVHALFRVTTLSGIPSALVSGFDSGFDLGFGGKLVIQILLPDVAEEVWQVSKDGLVVDPINYTLYSGGVAIELYEPITGPSTIVVQYLIETE